MSVTFAYGAFDSSTITELEVVNVARDVRGANRDDWVWVPGRAEPLIFAQPPGEKAITITCHLSAGSFTDRRDALNALADGLDEADAAHLIIDDEPDVYWLARVATAGAPDEWLSAADVDIVFRTAPYSFPV